MKAHSVHQFHTLDVDQVGYGCAINVSKVLAITANVPKNLSHRNELWLSFHVGSTDRLSHVSLLMPSICLDLRSL